jgi:hypothetical protein
MEINPVDYQEHIDIGYDVISWHIAAYNDNPESIARPGKITGLVDMLMDTLSDGVENRNDVRQYFIEMFTNRLKERGYIFV